MKRPPSSRPDPSDSRKSRPGHRVGPDWLGLYANSDDRRLWVPKVRPSRGWTINLGHPAARWIIAASAGGLIFGLALAYASTTGS